MQTYKLINSILKIFYVKIKITSERFWSLFGGFSDF